MCLRGSWVARTHYFVDANTLFTYQMKSRRDLVEFIEAQQDKFYFTESTRDEFRMATCIASSPNKRFALIESNITRPRKIEILGTFYGLWEKQLKQQRIEGQKPIVSVKQLRSFERNLLSVIEAKAANKDADAIFLTNNRAFYNRVVHYKEVKEIFECSLRLVGNENLMSVLFLDDVLRNWEKSV